MAIVGPRPQTEECYGYFPEKDRDRICQTKPGLTGVGSVNFRDEEEILARSPKGLARCYREDVMPYKLALELWYIEHQSFWLDLKLIFITVWVIAFPRSTIYRRWLKGLPLAR
jgi:lipopolysaccharide/colanic/teichoic acid biosynthesis glycosyltransferase